MVIGAVFTMIPFYFNTTAQTAQNEQTDKSQQLQLDATAAQLQHLDLNDAVHTTEIIQIKESLERIEKKIDRLIEERN